LRCDLLPSCSWWRTRHYLGVANYNYVTPYQHSQTHGMTLSLAMIVALGVHLRTGRFGSLVLAGMCMGLVFLTKVELFVPAAFVALVGLLGVLLTRTSRNQEGGITLRHASNRCATRVSRGDRKFSYSAVQYLTREGLTRSEDRPRPGLLVLSFAGAALVPIGGAYAVLRIQLPVALAVEGVMGNWNYLGGDLLADRFYLMVLGFYDPAANALVALRMFLGIAVLGAIVLGETAWHPPLSGGLRGALRSREASSPCCSSGGIVSPGSS
jgi:hypothetical protein